MFSMRWQRAALYGLFALSGLAGLIYESIWSHYLKLFLGHAAYAQSLVLIIFMGGMALGAWLAGGLSQRAPQPLLWYVAAEVALGVAGLSFDSVFRAIQAWFFAVVVPALQSPQLVDLIKWTLSGAVIFPQSVLLGATFPLISAGVVRIYSSQSGAVLGWLYFTNSLGASVGVLISGFVLIGKIGLPGTLLTAGIVNFALALGIYFIAREQRQTGASVPPRPIGMQRQDRTPGLLLLAAFITGLASFLYEIGWIRMLSLVLGSTTHSFELMLSVFIFGLAMGSFWIRNRIDSTGEPLRLLGWVQVIMAAAALLSLPLYMQSFGAMAAFWHAVQSNDGGYALYTIFSYGLCLVLMLPATFCAGMTLPLMTATLLRMNYGEAGIGRIYASNTVGAIAGVLLATHVVMPLLGLRQVVIVGALLDLCLGLWLLARGGYIATPAWRISVAAISGGSLLAALATSFDPAVTSSGAYRVGKARAEGEILFHADGKTATVDVGRAQDGTVYIATNGKVDAGLNLNGIIGPDDYTMVMLALLPLAMLPQAETAAVIGLGSGTSSHSLLFSPRLKRVDTIEIEPAMIDGARFFGPATENVYKDPRSRIWIEDAKTYFARAGERYDLILSEPSNPWVSGIATLFSTEFYSQIKRYLTDQGLFVQWLHLYEISPQLIATVVNALGDQFEDYAIYVTNGDDIMIVAKPDGRLPGLDPWIFSQPGLRQLTGRLGINRLDDLNIRQLGRKDSLRAYFRQLSNQANSDYFPVLDQGAARQRFVFNDARSELSIHPYSLRLEGRRDALGGDISVPAFHQPVPGAALVARAMARRLQGGDASAESLTDAQRAATATLRAALRDCSTAMPEDVLLHSLQLFSLATANQLPAKTAREVVRHLRSSSCIRGWGQHAHAWVDLYEGISLANPALVQRGAGMLLPTLTSSKEAAQFVVAELLLADLQTGGKAAAADRLAHVHGLPETPPLRYLRSYVESDQ